MTLDYEDHNTATAAHSLLWRKGLKVTFFPSRPMSSEGTSPRMVHRIIIANGDDEKAHAVLSEAGLLPPS